VLFIHLELFLTFIFPGETRLVLHVPSSLGLESVLIINTIIIISQSTCEKVYVDSAVACGELLTHSGRLSAVQCHHRHHRHPACPTHSSLHPCPAQLSARHRTRRCSHAHAPRMRNDGRAGSDV